MKRELGIWNERLEVKTQRFPKIWNAPFKLKQWSNNIWVLDFYQFESLIFVIFRMVASSADKNSGVIMKVT